MLSNDSPGSAACGEGCTSGTEVGPLATLTPPEWETTGVEETEDGEVGEVGESGGGDADPI